MSENQKPRLCEILGVEVEERFGIGEIECDFWINEKGDACSELYNLRTSAMWVLKAVNKPSLIDHKMCPTEQEKMSENKESRLTAQELAICNTIGAKWISYDKDCVGVNLWNDEPTKDEYDDYISHCVLAVVDKDLFPSIKTGDCIKV